VFFTDQRSPKIQEIGNNPHVALHCYIPFQRMQVRMLGRMTVLAQHPKMKQWREIALHRFADYGAPDPPGTLAPPIAQHPRLEIAQHNFCVLCTTVAEVELLQLGRPTHKRMVWRRENQQWMATNIIP